MMRTITPHDGWQRVAPRLITINIVFGIAWTLLFTMLCVGLFTFGPQTAALGVAAAAGALAHLIRTLIAARRFRAIGYRLEADELLFCQGIMFERVVSVPYGRVQLIVIEQGPLLRLAGLGRLCVVTAGVSVGFSIPGLPIERAERLRDELMALAETRRAGA